MTKKRRQDCRLLAVTDFTTLARAGALPAERAAVTIGNFDGCHLGHQELLARTRELAARFDAAPVAVTFSPRPEAFFRNVDGERLLFTEAQKTRALGEAGIALQVREPFDAAFAQVSHAAFYDEHLRRRLRAVAVAVGDDFRFGHKRLGSAAYLAERGAADGLAVATCHGVEAAGGRVSSSRTRELVATTGDAATLTALLGRPYLLEGRVATGDRLGRQLGFPTANLGDVGQLILARGVYAGYVHLAVGDAPIPVLRVSADAVPAVFNIGVRPTVATGEPTLRIEAHLLRGSYGTEALYGARVGYYFAHRLRDERRFPDLAALKTQIAADIAAAKALLAI
jgi:riboflavin kinase/FMN adenylyltransferase